LRGLLLGGSLLVLSVASAIALVGLVLLGAWAYLGLICIPILTLTDI